MKTFRKILFWMHLICGVFAGAVIFIMSITGVAMTYEKRMLKWADGHRAEAPSPGAQPMGLEALLETAEACEEKEPTRVRIYSGPEEPATVYFGRGSVRLNPYTGEAFGEGATGLRGFFRTMIVWHRWLGQEGDGRDVGKAITGACNLAFLFVVCSGLYLWWPKQWTGKHLRPIVWFRGGLPAKARDFNWHNVLGLWFAVPLALVVATATFFSYRWTGDLLYTLTGEEAPVRGDGSSSPEEELPPSFEGLDALWASAQSHAPDDWNMVTVSLPRDAEAPLRFDVDRGTGVRPDLRSTLVIDRRTHELLRVETAADQAVARQARSWIRWIHTGEAGGFLGETLAGLASAAACVLVYTGWMLTWRRFRAWQERRS